MAVVGQRRALRGASHGAALLSALLLASACSGEVTGGGSSIAGPGPIPTTPTPVPTTGTSGAGGANPTTPNGGATTTPQAGAPVTPAGGGAAVPTGGVTSTAGTPGVTPPVTPAAPANPGTVTVRRLNHAEYNNTVRDLLETTLTPADQFSADDPGEGFDTVGTAASLSPAYVRDYEETAHLLLDELFADAARRQTVLGCDVEQQGRTCAESAVSAFARKAWRRPVTPEEVQALMLPVTTAEQLGATASDGLRHALAAVLLSPHFIFKLEIDPDPASPAPRRLNGHELATRLSYALWSTQPDPPLAAAADAGTLQDDAVLAAEIERLLADPKAETLAQNFAAQWLEFRELDVHEVERSAFPMYSPTLADSMQREAERFFLEFLRTERPLGEMLSARFTYVDSTLATHYGLPAPTGMAPGELAFADTSTQPRVGLLTLGAVLTATSFSSRTSPVKRGEFVAKRLLCVDIQAPPPDVASLPEDMPGAQPTMTLRQRMEVHRQDVACIGCHALMDPIGFGLENYDAIGRYRTDEDGLAIDATGMLPDGATFTGALDLAPLLANDPRFMPCVTKKLMTFVLGRLMNQTDDPVWLAHLGGTVRDSSGGMGTLVRTVLRSEAFRSRQSVAQ